MRRKLGIRILASFPRLRAKGRKSRRCFSGPADFANRSLSRFLRDDLPAPRWMPASGGSMPSRSRRSTTAYPLICDVRDRGLLRLQYVDSGLPRRANSGQLAGGATAIGVSKLRRGPGRSPPSRHRGEKRSYWTIRSSTRRRRPETRCWASRARLARACPGKPAGERTRWPVALLADSASPATFRSRRAEPPPLPRSRLASACASPPRRVSSISFMGKARCALCGCALERPPVTSPASVAAFIVFAGPRPTDRYIGFGVCLRCAAEPDLADRLIRRFRLEEVVAGHC